MATWHKNNLNLIFLTDITWFYILINFFWKLFLNIIIFHSLFQLLNIILCFRKIIILLFFIDNCSWVFKIDFLVFDFSILFNYLLRFIILYGFFETFIQKIFWNLIGIDHLFFYWILYFIIILNCFVFFYFYFLFCIFMLVFPIFFHLIRLNSLLITDSFLNIVYINCRSIILLNNNYNPSSIIPSINLGSWFNY